jgi:hypothetical protein
MEYIPWGLSVTETKAAWYVRNRISEDEIGFLRLPHKKTKFKLEDLKVEHR